MHYNIIINCNLLLLLKIILHIDVYIITIYKQVQKVTIEINHINCGNPSLNFATKVGAQAKMRARRMF